MSRFHIVIPARYASTRLPGKPLRRIAGERMIVRVAQRAARSGAEECIVATDDERVLAVCGEEGIEALMTADSHRSGTDRCAEVAASKGWSDDEVVVNVQGDEPLIPPSHIALAARALGEGATDIATLACPFADLEEFLSPHAVKIVTDENSRALLFSRAPIPFERDSGAAATRIPPGALRHIGLYAYRVGALRMLAKLPPAQLELTESLEQLRALYHGLSIAVACVDDAPGPGVDTEEDIARVEAMLARDGDGSQQSQKACADTEKGRGDE